MNLTMIVACLVAGVPMLWFSGFVAGQQEARQLPRSVTVMSLAFMGMALILIMAAVQGAYYAHG